MSWLRSLLFGVAPDDALVIAGASIALAITATLAAYIPALRASSIDPIQALRTE